MNGDKMTAAQVAIIAAAETGTIREGEPGFALVLTGEVSTDPVNGAQLHNVQFELEAHGLDLTESQSLRVAAVALQHAINGVQNAARQEQMKKAAAEKAAAEVAAQKALPNAVSREKTA